MSVRPPPIYLDYNATAPLLPAAHEAMQRVLAEAPGNPSSPHGFGQAARDALETARASLAPRLGYSRREWLFTGGGTESNNAALRWLADLPPPVHLITTPIEHPSVLRCAEWLETRGVAVSTLPVGTDGAVLAERLPELLRAETRLVSVMAANNETGVLQPLERIGALVREARAAGTAPRVLLHSDAVQAFGRVPLALAEWGVDAATVAAHKLGGPLGIGALALREHAGMPGFLLGGKQERGRRAGTESVFLAAGFAAAAEWVFARLPELAARLAGLRDRLEAHVRDLPGGFVNGAAAPRVPNTTSLGFAGLSAQSLVVALDLDGIAVSTGSACSSGSLEPSHVLKAMGLPEERILGALRISLGWGTTEAEVDRCAERLRAQVQRLRGGGGVPQAKKAAPQPGKAAPRSRKAAAD
jgi:cysteine desulfurase